MTDYPASGVLLVADTAEYTRKMDDAIALADQFDAIGNLTLTISAEVDTASFDISDLPTDGEKIDITVSATVDADLNEIPADNDKIDITVGATVDADLSEIPTDGEKIDFTANGTVTGDVTKLPVDGEKVDITADVTENDASKAILSDLHSLTTMQTLSFVWNVTGNILGVLGGIEKFAVEPLLAVDDAVAKINAQTATAIPNVKGLVEGLHSEDLNDSYDVIAKTVIAAQQLGAPVKEAAESALEFTKVFTDQDPIATLNTMQTMVKTGLAPGFKEAGDMLTVAFQNGANRSGDLLTAINNNAVALKDMGYDGTTAISLIKQGLDGGYKSANDVAMSIVKIKQNATAAAGNDNSDFTKTLKMLDIANPAETGQAWSKDFLASVIAAIQNAPVSDTQKQAMLSAIMGGKLGSKDYSAVMGMDTATAGEMFAPMKDASKDAAKEIDNSLHGAIDDFVLAAQTAATNFLSSSQIDLPGKITALKKGLQEGLDVLAQGGTLGDALTIALKPIGFDDEFRGLEDALGNFIIGILQAVAAVQHLQGDTVGEAGTRSTIGKMAQTQLAYELKIANPDQIASDVSTAVSRGVSTQDVMKSAGIAVDELIKSGAIERAKTLVDALRVQAETGVQLKINPNLNSDDKAKVAAQLQAFGFGTLNSDGSISMNISPGMSADAIAGWSRTIVDTLTEDFGNVGTQQGVLSVDVQPTLNDNVVTVLQSKIDKAIDDVQAQKLADIKDASLTGAGIVNTASDGIKTNATAAVAPITAASTQITAVGNQSKTAAPQVQSTADATKKLGDGARGAALPVGDVSGQLDAMSITAPLAATGLMSLNGAIGAIIDTANDLDNASASMTAAQKAASGNTAADPGKHAAGGLFFGTGIVGDAGPEIVSSDTGLAVLNNATTERLMAALMGYIPGGNFSKASGNNYSVVNNNIVPNVATADALGYKTAEQLRGMG